MKYISIETHLCLIDYTSWATHDGWVMLEISDKMWSTGGGNGKLLQYSYLENPMNGMKGEKDMTLKDELPRASKSLEMVSAAMKLKDTCSLEEKLLKTYRHIQKQRHYFHMSSQRYGFSSIPVWM